MKLLKALSNVNSGIFITSKQKPLFQQSRKDRQAQAKDKYYKARGWL